MVEKGEILAQFPGMERIGLKGKIPAFSLRRDGGYSAGFIVHGMLFKGFFRRLGEVVPLEGIADVDAGLDIKSVAPVGFLPDRAQDTGKQAHRRFEDRLPALIINACLLCYITVDWF